MVFAPQAIAGLCKAEVVLGRRSWPNASAFEMATLGWVDWFNNYRLFGPTGHIPLAEAEAIYHAARATLNMGQKPPSEARDASNLVVQSAFIPDLHHAQQLETEEG